MHYLYVIVIDISSSFVSSLHASFLYGTQDGKICFVFFLVILKDATSVWRGKYFDVGGYFRFVIVQVNYDKYEWVPFFTWRWLHGRILGDSDAGRDGCLAAGMTAVRDGWLQGCLQRRAHECVAVWGGIPVEWKAELRKELLNKAAWK